MRLRGIFRIGRHAYVSFDPTGIIVVLVLLAVVVYVCGR